MENKNIFEKMGDLLMDELGTADSKEENVLTEGNFTQELKFDFDKLLGDMELILASASTSPGIKEILKRLNDEDIISTKKYQNFLRKADKLENLLNDVRNVAEDLEEDITIAKDNLYDREERF